MSGGVSGWNRVDRLVAFLADEAKFTGPEADEARFTAREIAEVLWLARRIRPAVTLAPESAPESAPEPIAPTPITPAEPIEEIEAPAPPEPVARPEPAAEIATPTAAAGRLPATALPLWVADPPLLSDPLAAIRSLRPLIRPFITAQKRRINEAATVDRIARSSLCLPVFEPDREPYFELLLAIDTGPSMSLWRRLGRDWVATLRRYGAFRDVRVVELVTSGGELRVRALGAAAGRDPEAGSDPSAAAEAAAGRKPSEWIEPNGRRIAIVFSDCVAEYWWDGRMGEVLRAWGKAMPTVVWQPLPEVMWRRTALGRGHYGAIANDCLGATNDRLRARWLGLDEPTDRDRRMVCPVTTLDERDLERWSRMVVGDRRVVTAGYWWPLAGGSLPSGVAGAAGAEAAQGVVEQFRVGASPKAQRLAMLLAAAPVISLPVMRLIRESMMASEVSPLSVAEVFLGGLLCRLPPEEGSQEGSQDGAPLADPETEQYDFLPGVREALQATLPKVDAIEVINRVSGHVADRLGYSSLAEFRAVLLNPQAEQADSRAVGLRSFAIVMAGILERLGGTYREFAEQLRRGALPESVLEPEPVPEPEWPPLETVEYEPALVVKVLERFEFEPATIARVVETTRQGVFGIGRETETRWQIQTAKASNWGYVEALGEGVDLVMMSIPGGRFLMGSPDGKDDRLSTETFALESPKGEIDRFDNEGPQHRVTVQPFYLGRTAITQAQWRVVAGYPAIERELEADPARFKGDNRPVERVSWDDAVEFCARLCAATGQTYRLPSEAEWEYACRAGTTTPFHFGETISTDLANYRGTDYPDLKWSGSYADGPKGEYREATVEVGSLPPNDFGLYEMHGNVWEWCEDDWHSNYEGAPDDGSAWLSENRTESNRLLRGGSWISYPRYCRSACRDVNYGARALRDGDGGFRVVCLPSRTLSP